MPEPFIPFGSKSNPEAATSTAAQANPAPFKPFGHQPEPSPNSGNTPSPDSSPNSAQSSAGAPHTPHAHAHAAPIVTLKRDETDGRVTQIQIRCSCGEIMDLDCAY